MARETVSCMGLESDFGFEHGVHGHYGAFGADAAATAAPPQIVIQSASAAPASKTKRDFLELIVLSFGAIGAFHVARDAKRLYEKQR
jgi:hypothetical protein